MTRPPFDCTCCSRDRALLVSLANGKLVALDRHTGRQLWAFDSGAPLLSSTNRQAAAGAAQGSLTLSEESGERCLAMACR